MSITRIIPAIKEVLQEHRWTRLLLAVSGGVDSICLAHLFEQHKLQLGIEWLGIAHVHHGLREITADLDADLVRDFATKHNTEYFEKRLDGNILKEKGSLEENARKARYEALFTFARENQADAILTAHHAGDQAETVYFRLRRGVSLAGLSGISPVNGMVYRPFLSVSRQELVEYAQMHLLDWREDESNSDIKFARNQIRHEALPHLEKTNPGASQQLCRLANLAGKVYHKVMEKVSPHFESMIIPQEEWTFDHKYSCYSKVMALDAKKLENQFKNITEKSTTASPGGISELFRLWLMEKGFRLPLQEKGTSFSYPFPQRSQCKTILMEKCRHILWICDTTCPFQAKTELDNLYLSVDNFSSLTGQWRFRLKGDTLWPADEKIKARKLEHWLREQGIPQWMHDSLPLFACGSRVLFVKGVQQAKKVDDLKKKNDKG